MSESAPTGIIQPIDQQNAVVHQKIQSNLRQIGQPIPTQPPTEQPIERSNEFAELGVDAAHIIGSTYADLVTGEGGGNRDRVTSGKNLLRLGRERLAKLNLVQKKTA